MTTSQSYKFLDPLASPSSLPHSRNLFTRTIVMFWNTPPLSRVTSFMNGSLPRQAWHSGRGEERIVIRKLKCQKFFAVIYPPSLLCSGVWAAFALERMQGCTKYQIALSKR